jgi:hypothetical protein
MSTIIQITYSQFSIFLVLFSILQFLLSNWIKNRLEKSIQHEYDKKLEDYKFSQLQRQKAETIANYFALWTKYRGNEEKILNKNELITYYEDLSRMSLELSLWIKDGELLNEIMSRTQNKEGSSDIRTIIGKIRKLILGIEVDKFNSEEITLWPTDKKSDKLFKE